MHTENATVRLPYVGEANEYKGKYPENWAMNAEQLGSSIHQLKVPPQQIMVKHIVRAAMRYAAAAAIAPDHSFNQQFKSLHGSLYGAKTNKSLSKEDKAKKALARALQKKKQAKEDDSQESLF